MLADRRGVGFMVLSDSRFLPSTASLMSVYLGFSGLGVKLESRFFDFGFGGCCGNSDTRPVEWKSCNQKAEGGGPELTTDYTDGTDGAAQNGKAEMLQRVGRGAWSVERGARSLGGRPLGVWERGSVVQTPDQNWTEMGKRIGTVWDRE